MGPIAASVTSGIDNSDVCSTGAALSGLVTVSHNAHGEAPAVTGVACGAPGMPTHAPLVIALSSEDFTTVGLAGLPRISRAELRLNTGCRRPVTFTKIWNVPLSA